MSSDVASSLTLFEQSLNELLTKIRRTKAGYINRKDIQIMARGIVETWFRKFEPLLNNFGVTEDVQSKYNTLFRRLLALSGKGNQSSTYTSLIGDILANFHDDISIPYWRSDGKGIDLSTLYKIMGVATVEEQDYLTEAIGCAKYEFFRAATILVWSAAIHRMHKKVENLGFAVFSQKSHEMKALDAGRYKRFKKSFDINNLTELAMNVFDTDLLWVLEYIGLIDGNQHDRLEICFTMRSNSAHPGEAKMTPENFLSFCSDVYEFVFANSKFDIAAAQEIGN